MPDLRCISLSTWEKMPNVKNNLHAVTSPVANDMDVNVHNGLRCSNITGNGSF